MACTKEALQDLKVPLASKVRSESRGIVDRVWGPRGRGLWTELGVLEEGGGGQSLGS